MIKKERKRSIKTLTFVLLDNPSKKKRKTIQSVIINIIIMSNNGVEVMCSGKSMIYLYVYIHVSFPKASLCVAFLNYVIIRVNL